MLGVSDNVAPHGGGGGAKKGNMGTGRETLRLRSKGPATVQVVSGSSQLVYTNTQ